MDKKKNKKKKIIIGVCVVLALLLFMFFGKSKEDSSGGGSGNGSDSENKKSIDEGQLLVDMFKWIDAGKRGSVSDDVRRLYFEYEKMSIKKQHELRDKAREYANKIASDKQRSEDELRAKEVERQKEDQRRKEMEKQEQERKRKEDEERSKSVSFFEGKTLEELGNEVASLGEVVKQKVNGVGFSFSVKKTAADKYFFKPDFVTKYIDIVPEGVVTSSLDTSSMVQYPFDSLLFDIEKELQGVNLIFEKCNVTGSVVHSEPIIYDARTDFASIGHTIFNGGGFSIDVGNGAMSSSKSNQFFGKIDFGNRIVFELLENNAFRIGSVFRNEQYVPEYGTSASNVALNVLYEFNFIDSKINLFFYKFLMYCMMQAKEVLKRNGYN